MQANNQTVRLCGVVGVGQSQQVPATLHRPDDNTLVTAKDALDERLEQCQPPVQLVDKGKVACPNQQSILSLQLPAHVEDIHGEDNVIAADHGQRRNPGQVSEVLAHVPTFQHAASAIPPGAPHGPVQQRLRWAGPVPRLLTALRVGVAEPPPRLLAPNSPLGELGLARHPIAEDDAGGTSLRKGPSHELESLDHAEAVGDDDAILGQSQVPVDLSHRVHEALNSHPGRIRSTRLRRMRAIGWKCTERIVLNDFVASQIQVHRKEVQVPEEVARTTLYTEQLHRAPSDASSQDLEVLASYNHWYPLLVPWPVPPLSRSAEASLWP
mmetsp:Transcript_81702/g.243613  ORF Transcript_81702/g.243613 Transcript_81702/m.243613 type:complete len:325 (-) Transcript_81702:135-1109(-)